MIVVHKVTEYKIIKAGVQGPSGSVSIFNDNSPIVQNAIDTTKKLRFDLSAITTGQTRVITMPDADVDLGLYAGHISASEAVHGLGAGSAVVGTLESQTLYGKTLNAPEIQYSYNNETLTGNKTVTVGIDEQIQHLNPNGANRTITVADGTAEGQCFEFYNTNPTDDGFQLIINITGTANYGKLARDQAFKIFWTGTEWLQDQTALESWDFSTIAIGYGQTVKGLGGIAIGSVAAIVANDNIAIGPSASCGAVNDIVIGAGADASSSSLGDNVLLGKQSFADANSQRSIAIGTSSYTDGEDAIAVGGSTNSGADFAITMGYQTSVNAIGGIAIGHQAASVTTTGYAVSLGYQSLADEDYSIALGANSYTSRWGEFAITVDKAAAIPKSTSFEIYWYGTTANATPAEIFLGGVASNRCTVKASSVMKFTISVTARDNTTGDCAAYEFTGAIKRDAANNTALVGGNVSKSTIAEDDASWDVAVTADDTNEALIITVTGDTTNTVQWAAVANCVETNF